MDIMANALNLIAIVAILFIVVMIGYAINRKIEKKRRNK